MKSIHLRAACLAEPIGIDILKPHLEWNCDGGIQQTAYQVIAKVNGETVWDSGKVESSSMTGISYRGRALHSRERVDWSVRLWDENGQCGEFTHSFFEMGLLEPSDWKAKWIAGDYKVNRKKRYPVDCFLKLVHVAESVKSARLYITACGLYEAKMDGSRIGDFIMAPGHTDYRKRVQYQTYDVTKLLTIGDHALTVQLADGWYRGSCGAWGLKNQYGTQTKLIAQLEISYVSGRTDTIVTDESWAWSNDGPIRFADNKDGERIDANQKASYGGKAKVTTHNVTPAASDNVPVTEHEQLIPQKIITSSGKTVLDFGQNIAGYVSFRVNAKSGQMMKLRFGEMLDRDGEFTQKNIQLSTKHITTPLQQVEYICAEGENSYKTTFAVFGFQYVQVEAGFEIDPADFTAIAVYSDMERTGHFSCSNHLLNQLFEATVWSAKGNHLDVPTDCPTRERHGWSGDAQIFFDTASYIFDFRSFSAKYLQDLYDWQTKDGKLPQIAPYGGVDFYMSWMDGSVGWADAGVLIPYRYWKQYGDDSLIRKHYAAMVRYARFMTKRCYQWTPLSHKIPLKGKDKQYIVNYGQSYGEWAEPADVFPNHWTQTVLPHPEESTAYTVFIMEKMEEIAGYMQRPEDQAFFAQYKDRCKASYQKLVAHADYTLDTDRQAKLVRPLYMGLLTDSQRKYARKRLIQALENYGWRLGTGFLSTPLILDVLAEYDLDAAYRLLENEEMPGWLFMPKNGATTIWESWEGTQAQGGIASLNHYSKGAVCEWLFKTMCGIHIDVENHFIIAPKPGGNFTYARARYNSIYGTVESSWEKLECNYTFIIQIPGNTTATIVLPDGTSRTVTEGIHKFDLKI